MRLLEVNTYHSYTFYIYSYIYELDALDIFLVSHRMSISPFVVVYFENP